MAVLTEILTLGLVMTNFRLLAVSRLAALINTMALQAVLLSLIPMTMGPFPWSLRLTGLTLVTLAVKAVLLPWLLLRAMRTVAVQREVEPFLGYSASVITGVLLLGMSFWIIQPLKATTSLGSPSLMAGALFTTMVGLMMIITRRKALTQVIGYLAMENGVYVFGTALAVEEPLLVEMGVLLDVFVAVFVMGITIHQISREFDHIDTDRLSELRD